MTGGQYDGTSCPGCQSAHTDCGFVIPLQPVVLNYRFDAIADARAVRRDDVALVQFGYVVISAPIIHWLMLPGELSR